MEVDPDSREQIFHNTVREYTIFLLLFLLLYVSSYVILNQFRRRDRDDYLLSFTGDEDEATVYRISLWLCTFSLAVSVGAVLLLPFSIVSNEVLLLYPRSYYVKWLNSSLVHGLWKYIFLFSNLSLFMLLPFAYLFTESEGFIGYKKGILSRVYETFVVLSLLAVLVLGMAYILSAVIDRDRSSLDKLLNVWTYYLPFLYSCISFIGVLLLLLCTPLGFAHFFTLVGQLIIKPQFLRDLNEEYFAARFEKEVLERRLKNGFKKSNEIAPSPVTPIEAANGKHLQNGNVYSTLEERLAHVQRECKKLDVQRNTSVLRRNLGYPTVMIVLIALTSTSVLMVMHNTLQLLVGIKALPLGTEQFSLGISSLSALGMFGAVLEIILILYLIMTSIVGVYTIPILRRIRPKMKDTPMTHLILNCAIILILSSALPLLSRILGITNFDLLGDFGRIKWLGNFHIILFYNLVFAGASALCLVNKLSATVRREIYMRFKLLVDTVMKQDSHKFILLNGTASPLPVRED